MEDALQLLKLFASDIITKTRLLIPFEGHTWEVDVFEGDNDGLIVAEIELKQEHETFALPSWVAEEVTDDARYYNASLSLNPYKNWKPND